MRLTLVLFSLLVLLCLSSAALSEDLEIDVNINEDRGPRFHTFDSPTPPDFGKYFPHGPGGISGPFTNPEPRKPSDMPACYYDASGTLFYERAGKHCPYKWQSPNEKRVERRRQEWLHAQELRGDSPKE